jgi:hypothetical protein
MRRLTLLALIAAAALLVSGCYGYGPHMGWDDHDSHMRSYQGDGDPTVPCNPASGRDPYGNPCRRAQ